MRKQLLSIAVLSALTLPAVAFSAEEVASDWAFSANTALTSDYYVRGLSQTYHKTAIQGGFDAEHSSGFSAGVWASNISSDTFPDANMELDIYAGYGGEIGDSGVGYSVGVIGYTYPGGRWADCTACTKADLTTPVSDNDWNTYEANFGLSYGNVSGQVSTTLGNWFGLDKGTGYTDDTKFSTYVELNADFPLGDGWSISGHVGHLNVKAKLAASIAATTPNGEDNLDYTDYKLALAKSFSLAGSEGWGAELAYVGANDSGYWSEKGWGGSSFNGRAEVADLADDRFTFTVSRSF